MCGSHLREICFIASQPPANVLQRFLSQTSFCPQWECVVFLSTQGTSYIGESCEKTMKFWGITGHRTNHSCRKSSATCLSEERVDEQLICEKTCHRSLVVRSYKHTSNNQLKDLTDILYGNTKTSQAKKIRSQ